MKRQNANPLWESSKLVYGDVPLFEGLSDYRSAEGRLPQTEHEILCNTAFAQAYPNAIIDGKVQLYRLA